MILILLKKFAFHELMILGGISLYDADMSGLRRLIH